MTPFLIFRIEKYHCYYFFFRVQGESSVGKISFRLCNKIGPKDLFYQLKKPLKHGMITKQCVTIIINGINNVGLLFHLPRFYVEYRLKWQQNLYKIVKFLKTQTKGIGAYDEIQGLSFDTFFFFLSSELRKIFDKN